MKKTTITAAVTAALLGLGGAGVAIGATIDFGGIYTPSPDVHALTFVDTDGIDADDPSGLDNVKLNDNAADEKYQNAKALAEGVVDDFSSVDGYFTDAEVNAIFNALGNADAETAELNELIPFVISNYKGSDMACKLSVPTNYKIGAKVAVVFFITDADGNVSVQVAYGTVIDNGLVSFKVNSDIAKAAAAGNVAVGIINAAGDVE